MKTRIITIQKLEETAKGMTAAEFESWLSKNYIDYIWTNINPLDRNQGIYEVYLEDYGYSAYYEDGVFVKIA